MDWTHWLSFACLHNVRTNRVLSVQVIDVEMLACLCVCSLERFLSPRGLTRLHKRACSRFARELRRLHSLHTGSLLFVGRHRRVLEQLHAVGMGRACRVAQMLQIDEALREVVQRVERLLGFAG